MCMVKPHYISAEKFGLFAMRLPSLSRGKWTGLLGCGITFEKKIHADDLDDGYNIGTCNQRYEVRQCLQNICYM